MNLSDGGYLYDPDSKYGHIYNPEVKSFEFITKIPCLALLGEPGMGKTQTLRSEFEILSKIIPEHGDKIFWLDLRSYGSEDRLIRNLFESPAFIAWKDGDYRLHLFLDSLDECLLRIDTLAGLLNEELQKYPVERLYLRIACRTAEWPISLENGLIGLWGSDAVKVFELTPLRRVDVEEAAKTEGLQPEKFLEEVDNKEVVPLAIKPITLKFLFNTYIKNHEFPSTQEKLYFKGCRLLCEESNPERRETRFASSLSPDQKLAIAARIAAVTVFANRYAIWTGIDMGDAPAEDVVISDIYGGTEKVEDNDFEIREDLVKEVLSTGLFSSRGANRMGWAHQTYAEFLAAHYVAKNRMVLPQIKSLLTHHSDPEGKLAPQLHEVAAWLSCMMTEVFQEITKTDPDVLLRSDAAKADVKSREALVESILKQLDEEKLSDRDLQRKLYRKLAHPRLVEQLRPYISDSGKGIFVRQAAIDIAEACELRVLQDELVNIALDHKEPILIRREAAFAISLIGDDDVKAKLWPLGTGEAGDDPEDELKGCALRALWPAIISAEDLFAILTPPKRESLFGAYWAFLSYDLGQHLKPSDLPVALSWVEEQSPQHGLPYAFQGLTDTIMLQGWDHLEMPGVAEAFSKTVLSRVKQHDEIVGGENALRFHDSLRNEDDKRRQILQIIVPMLSGVEKDLFVFSPPALTKDIPWMIERLQIESSEGIQKLWARLIHRVFEWEEPGTVDVVLRACQSTPCLVEEFAWLLKPVELNSREAEKMKADYIERQKWLDKRKTKPALQPPLSERIAELLNKFEYGDLSAWWRLNKEMTLEPDGTYYGDEIESNLMALPGWKVADDSIRARIIEAAKRYVLGQNPETNKWLGANTLHRPALAGYRALKLLMQVASDFVSALPAEVWKKWAPIILSYPTPSVIGREELHHSLVKIAYQRVPDEIIETLLLLIDKENKDHGHIFIINKIEHCLDELLAKALLLKAKDTEMKPACMGNLLRDLLEYNFYEAKAFAESLITSPLSTIAQERLRAVIAASVLMKHADDAGWSVVWPAIQQAPDFGREVLSEVSYRSSGKNKSIADRLSEDQLSDLYIWLSRQFPHKEDPKYDGAHTVGARESVAGWRDSILRNLQQRGTEKACDAIRHVIRELPELDWLKWVLIDAQAHTRRQTWTPPKPQEIIKLTHCQKERLVQNGDQLTEVIIKSLERLEEKLQGETPAAIFLWDTRRGIYEPKSENEFSDYVKLHLVEDLREGGIIVNREVEIRRGEGIGKGERTDIHVDAVVRGARKEIYDSVTVIIEVKGCWNPDLKNAMKTQLADRYLRDNNCQNGIYLIGWFNCEQWHNEDYRKKNAPALTIEEAQKLFDDQALELLSSDIRIKAIVINTALR